jgi:hypothetical protein
MRSIWLSRTRPTRTWCWIWRKPPVCPAEHLYFNIERVGNTSSASILLAIHDAVREGRIDRPMRVFAPGFGAGAVGGYVVMRVDPAVVQLQLSGEEYNLWKTM